MKNVKLTPPERLEKRLLLSYPDLDSLTERMLGAKNEMGWPDWCYLPMGASYAIVTQGAEVGIAQRLMAASGIGDLEALSAVIPWRLHKVIFRFDPEFADEITRQDTVPGDIPAALLQHMPYPCVYIQDPPGVDQCEGVFVFLEWDHRYPDAMELRMHYLFSDQRIVQLFYQFTDDQETLAARFAANNEETFRKFAKDLPLQDEKELARWRQCVENMPRHLSMLVYLCSDEPDFSRTADVPRRRGRGAVKTAGYPDRVEVGSYIGGVIRMGRKAAEGPEADEIGPSGSGSPKRPHMRRAHWHLYWSGEGRKVPRVKWISPVFIHGEGREPPTVIHPVK